MATAKTNAVRLLERLGIPFELREYDVDPDDLAAETVARKVGLPPEQVFKTLVARGDKHGVCLAGCDLRLMWIQSTWKPNLRGEPSHQARNMGPTRGQVRSLKMGLH